MRIIYLCPFCDYETEDPRSYIPHLTDFHDWPKNPPQIKRYVIIRIEKP